MAPTTTAKLQQFRANSREMTQVKSSTVAAKKHEILHRFMAVVVSRAFRKSLSLASQARMDPLSRDRCSNAPVALCFSEYRKIGDAPEQFKSRYV